MQGLNVEVAVPLSEHEQRMLDQLEEALAADDPKFVSSMGKSGGVRSRKRWLIGAVGVAAGLGLVLLGISTTVWVGVAGFAMMVAAVAYAIRPAKSATLGLVGTDGSVKPRGKRDKKGPSDFMSKLDDRWDRRNNDGWYN